MRCALDVGDPSFGTKVPTFGKSLKNMVLKVSILKILRKPSKRRLGFLKSFKNLRIEGYDLRPGLVHCIDSVVGINIIMALNKK